MNQIKTCNSTELMSPGGHYSHVSTYGGFAFIAGQLPIDGTGRILADRPFEEQARQVLSNIDACLRCVGIGRETLLQIRVFITDMESWKDFDGVYADWIGTHRPARLVAGVKELHFGALLEIEATAAFGPEIQRLSNGASA